MFKETQKFFYKLQSYFLYFRFAKHMFDVHGEKYVHEDAAIPK